MSEQSTFDFGENGICKPDPDGRYRAMFFYYNDDEGVSEAEAIRQWLCGAPGGLQPYGPNWKYIERLVELAEGDNA